MFSALGEIFGGIARLFSWWVIIAPWEQALRIRLGGPPQMLKSGMRLCIPFIDRVEKKCVRRRLVIIRPCTLTTRDGMTITVSGTLGYCVKNIITLFNTLQNVTDTLDSMVAALVAETVATSNKEVCTPEYIQNIVREKLDLTPYGLGDEEFYLTNFAKVRTYRIITGDLPEYTREVDLSTQ